MSLPHELAVAVGNDDPEVPHASRTASPIVARPRPCSTERRVQPEQEDFIAIV